MILMLTYINTFPCFFKLFNIFSMLQVIGNFSDGIDISGPSTTTANSVEDCNDANSSFSSGETTGGGGGPTRTNL